MCEFLLKLLKADPNSDLRILDKLTKEEILDVLRKYALVVSGILQAYYLPGQVLHILVRKLDHEYGNGEWRRQVVDAAGNTPLHHFLQNTVRDLTLSEPYIHY
jgi:hypothetical protein